MSGIDRQVLVGESVQTRYHLGADLAVESCIADGRPLQESLSPVSAGECVDISEARGSAWPSG
jgi:hypothetical protein